MARFVGNQRLTIDIKGRLVLPARYRAHFGAEAYVTPYEDGCLAIWTVDEFNRQLDEQESVIHRSVDVDRRLRKYNVHSVQVDIDKQGRFVLPLSMRTPFGLGEEVVVAGNRDHLEIWSIERFDAMVADLDIFNEPIASTVGNQA